jgi:hypothetical protein
MRAGILCFSLMVAAGCTTARSATQGIDDPARMICVVSGHIPPGTPVEEAKRFMEQEGFGIDELDDFKFGKRKGLNCLLCGRWAGGFIGYSTWEVALVVEDGKVVEVLAEKWHTGPSPVLEQSKGCLPNC